MNDNFNIKNLLFKYGDVNSKFSLEIENLIFEKNSISCVLGQNGSGKTTLLNLIGGHLNTSFGKMYLNGKDIISFPANRRPTSTLFQKIGLFPHLTVKENIEIALEPNTYFKNSKETLEMASEILLEFDLLELQNSYPDQISVGQQQRVGLARSLSTKPEILLLDEPTSALDFYNIRRLTNILKKIHHQSRVPYIILISHDLPFVLNIADSIKYIEKGKIVFNGSVEDFKISNYYIK